MITRRELFALGEKHSWLSGWVGAIGSLFAIFATYQIASCQSDAERLEKISRRNQFIDLILTVVEDMERVLAHFLGLARVGYETLIAEHQWRMSEGVDIMNTPAFHAGRDLAFTRVMDWPSVECYKYYKAYWTNTDIALGDGVVLSENELHRAIVARDSALAQLRTALQSARSLPI